MSLYEKLSDAYRIFREFYTRQYSFWTVIFISGCVAVLSVTIEDIFSPRELVDAREKLQSSQQSLEALQTRLSDSERQLRNLQTRWNIDKKTIRILEDNNNKLDARIDRLQQEVAFFRRIVAGRENNKAISIRGLEVTPDITDDSYRLNTTLIRGRRNRKPFVGYYFFEVILREKGKQRVLRFPESEDAGKLDFSIYHEIDEAFSVPHPAEMINLRLKVLDEGRNEVVVQRLWIEEGDDE